MRRRFAAIVAAITTVLAAACAGTSASFDLDGLETEIHASLADAYDPVGNTLFDVSCPRSAGDAAAGDVFACVADVERQFVRIRVELLTDGSWEWTTLDLVMQMDDTEALVAQEMSTRLNDTITLDCGAPNLRVLPLGSALRCTATDSGRNAVAAILTVNGAGQVAWELLR